MQHINQAIGAIAQQVAESPKVAQAAAVATAATGLASITDVVHGALSAAAIIVGLVVSILLGRLHWIKYKNEVLKNRILRRQAGDAGLELEGED